MSSSLPHVSLCHPLASLGLAALPPSRCPLCNRAKMRVRVDAEAYTVEYASPSATRSEVLDAETRGTVPLPAIFLPGHKIGPLTPSSTASDMDCPPMQSLSSGPMAATPPTPPADAVDPTSAHPTDPTSHPTDPSHTQPNPQVAAHAHALSHPARMPQVWLTFRLTHADAQRDLTVPMIVHHRVHDYIPLIRHQLGLGLGLRFVYAGVLLRPEDTPLSLGIRGPDVVEVVGGEV